MEYSHYIGCLDAALFSNSSSQSAISHSLRANRGAVRVSECLVCGALIEALSVVLNV
jgi:hypothetical protein